MRVGYVRVSTSEQNTTRQEVSMEQLGVEKIFIEKVSGKTTTGRKQLEEMLNFIREGDTVVVESISRLARNTKDLLSIIEKFEKNGVYFISLKENISTNTPTGKFMLTVFGAVAQLEREYILARQKEGIAIAKSEGKYKGRKPITVDKQRFLGVYKRWKNGEITARASMKELGLKHSTFYRKVKLHEENNLL
ncbi:recombinase family protein [Clostridium botulinum]|uniref:recombinase family protein n=1 Tax=Clostridium TaxID=1485 RepID=UPI0013C8BE03|nr:MULTISPECIES: recombinase family protein [Clostridium]MCS6132255.1 recombinase family protein [Clostridium botulinum]NFL45677.1 recombinase family protein [Clostridium botulinum]NFL90574.1 recombinase family protein [Clostridium botulinum]NFN29937.1 recombinase family protein [Clostridium botulinum]NFO50299.1 recombinase family protein [Clostridium botulinum]